jgi:hypothetical protein
MTRPHMALLLHVKSFKWRQYYGRGSYAALEEERRNVRKQVRVGVGVVWKLGTSHELRLPASFGR